MLGLFKNMETKTCKICNAEKPTSNFYKKSSYCKQCSIEYSKNYYQEHKEELAPYYRAKTKQYGIDHPDYWSDYKKTHDESEPTKEKRSIFTVDGCVDNIYNTCIWA